MAEEKVENIDDAFQTMLLLREIVENVKPLNDAIDTLNEENNKNLANVDESIQRGYADIVAKITSIEDRVSTSQAGHKVLASPAKQEAKKLTKAEAEKELVSLRDQIFNRMVNEIDGFKHYHNVLQRPLINAALSAQCRDLASFKSLKQFQMRMQRNPQHFADKQIELFGAEVGDLLERIDYSARVQQVPDFDFDDDLPF